jgi:hypothetical protein
LPIKERLQDERRGDLVDYPLMILPGMARLVE